MPVKDVYGKEVSRETHMKFAYNPTSALLNELKNKKMSDREIMNAKGLGKAKKYPTSTSRFDTKSINNPNLIEGWKYKDTKFKSKTKYPDAKKHQLISFVKSAIRIMGYGLLVVDIFAAVSVLILSEAIGIIEELV